MPDKISSEQILKLEALKKTYVAGFGNTVGKAILKDLEKKCFCESSTLSKDPTVMGFREGQRAVVLYIKNMINYDLERIKKIAKQQEESEG